MVREGNAALRKVQNAARAALADRLADLSARERMLIARAMARVRAAVVPSPARTPQRRRSVPGLS